MNFGVVTLFPSFFEVLKTEGVVGRAFQKDFATLQCVNPRDFATDKHRTVDDRPFGGGPGMLMRPEPLVAAIQSLKTSLPTAKVVYLSPQGKTMTQSFLQEEVASDRAFILIAGRYEGIDERVIELVVDEEWSLGDFVLSGGEIAAMAVIDAMTRLVPGVLGHEDSADEDSFGAKGLLDCPHYTRPTIFEGLEVPEVLKSGDHQKIAAWRHQQQLERTQKRRTDLWNAYLKKQKV